MHRNFKGWHNFVTRLLLGAMSETVNCYVSIVGRKNSNLQQRCKHLPKWINITFSVKWLQKDVLMHLLTQRTGPSIYLFISIFVLLSIF